MLQPIVKLKRTKYHVEIFKNMYIQLSKITLCQKKNIPDIFDCNLKTNY